MFENKAGVPVVLTVHDKPTLAGSRTVKVTPADYSEQQGDLLRYDDWVRGNMAQVNLATGGKVGYVHLPDTYFPGMESFFRFFYPQLDKQALDLGSPLQQRRLPSRLDDRAPEPQADLLFPSALRKSADSGARSGYFGGAMACIANEWAESGGEVFATTFRLTNSGPIIGRRTSGTFSLDGRIPPGGRRRYRLPGGGEGE